MLHTYIINTYHTGTHLLYQVDQVVYMYRGKINHQNALLLDFFFGIVYNIEKYEPALTITLPNSKKW